MADTVSATTGVASARRVRVRRRPSFLLAVVVAVGALAFGSGLGRSGPPSAAQRVAALEAVIRCPSCDDISVAQSTTTSAIAVRHEVHRLVASGASNQAIEARLVGQYGPSILLSPPASGLTAVVWVLPVVGGAIAAAVVAIVLWRRARAFRALSEPT